MGFIDSPWSPDLVLVSTPEELEAAVVRGFAHIELRAHMDLAALALPPNGLAVIPKTVRSIRVRFY